MRGIRNRGGAAKGTAAGTPTRGSGGIIASAQGTPVDLAALQPRAPPRAKDEVVELEDEEVPILGEVEMPARGS